MYEDTVSDILREHQIEYVVSLPCDRTKDLCSILEDRFRYITISREEDGVGICSGLSLMQKRSVLQMQSSGLGNSLNALLTLPQLYGLPLPILASWRGFYQEQIPAQIPFNEKIPELLDLYKIPCTIITSSGEIPKIGSALSDAFENNRPHVILISPRVWEGKSLPLDSNTDPRVRAIHLTYAGTIHQPVMKRADAIQTIASSLTDEFVICNIGVPSKELYTCAERNRNFYMLGSYTQATPIALGVALGTKEKVLVLDGDGSMLGTAVLPVVASCNPKNLTIICLDNGVYGSTGNQCSPAHQLVDLELIAKANGIERTCKVHTPDELNEMLKADEEGPRFIHVIIAPGNSQVPNIPLTPEQITSRFMKERRI